MLARFESREEISPDVWEYRFIPERPLDYIAGQYVAVHILRDFADPRGRSRVFTLTSLPTDPHIAFALKFPDPGSQYKRELRALQPGETVRLSDAMGDVVLPKIPSIPLVFIAGGLGIASFVSSLRLLETTQEARNIQLFYSRRTKADNPYGDLVGRFPFTDKQFYIAPDRLTVATVLQACHIDTLIYISGSQTFVEGMRRELAAGGIAFERIVFDYYDGYASL